MITSNHIKPHISALFCELTSGNQNKSSVSSFLMQVSRGNILLAFCTTSHRTATQITGYTIHALPVVSSEMLSDLTQ